MFFLCQLKKNASNELVEKINKYIASHYEGNVPPTEANILIDAINNQAAGKSYDEVYNSLYLLLVAVLRQEKIEILYIGNQDKLKSLLPHIDTPSISQINFLSGNESNEDEIKRCVTSLVSKKAPFIIYDPEGLKISLSVDSQQILGCVSIYELLYAGAIPVSNVINNHTYFLARQYNALTNKNNRSVIIGNSYGLYGLPDSILKESVNISTHSLGLKQALLLVEHINIHYPHIKNFVFCLGFFDLYSDLLKTQDSFNQSIIVAFSQIISHFGIKREGKSQNDEVTLLSELLLKTSSPPQLTTIDDIQIQDSVYHSTISHISSKAYPEKGGQTQTARHRAVLHSNSVGHRASLEENKEIVDAIKNRIAVEGKKAIWLTPPFPDEYVKNIHSDMKITHRHFFAGLNDIHSTFIDLSENRNFRRYDFRDGDHLNFSGASKLVQKLRKMNIPI